VNEIASQYSLPPPEHGRVPFDADETTTLRDYWFVIYRRRRPAMIFFLAAVFLTAMSIPWGSRQYTATTTLYMQRQTQGMFDPESMSPLANVSYQQTQQQLLRSRSLAAQVIRDLNLEGSPLFAQTAQSPLSWVINQLTQSVGSWVTESRLVTWIRETFLEEPKKTETRTREFELGVDSRKIDQYLRGLTVTPSAESHLIKVEFTSPAPALSQKVVNSHVAIFISRNLATRFELTAETRQFLEKKLAALRVNVENSEKALTQFQRSHAIVSLDKGGGILLDELKKLNADLTEARSRRIELESLLHVVKKGDNQLLTQMIDNPFVQQLRKQIADLESQVAALATRYQPTYPGVVMLQEQVDEAKSRLKQELNRIVQSVEKDYGAATAKETALTAEAQKARQKALDLQENAVAYTVLEREVESNRALYETVFKKTKEAALTGGEPVPNLRVVDRAEIPASPDRGVAQRNLILGITIALLGALGLAFLLDHLDDSLKTPDDVGRFVHLPTLGIVPDLAKLTNGRKSGLGYTANLSPPQKLLEAPKGYKNRLIVSHHPLSLMAEMYRSICTSILFSQPDKPPRTILVTSTQPNEGKTVTAINIAMILAQSSGPVLLIDADLHNGHCHELLGLSNGSGLSNALTSDEDPRDYIKKTKVNNLSVLSRGIRPPNPADLLGSDKMRRILEALAADFTFIVIDSAPLLPVSDTVLLAPKSDGVILVARGGEVSRQLVRKARERLDYVKAKILGVVLNGVDISNAEYGEYRYIYGAHYPRYSEEEHGAVESWGKTPSPAPAVEATPAKIIASERDEEIAPTSALERVPASFFDRLVALLTECAGGQRVHYLSAARIIVYDEIAALGESAEAFPRARLEELVQGVTRAVSDHQMKMSFQKKVSEEIRSFGLA
jgi:succinoglycan biosynthesis transport protein ExoP